MADTPAANIAAAVTAKTTGTAPVAPDAKADPKATAPVADPNAGKEKYVVDGKDIYLSPEQARAYVQKGIAFEPKVSELARLQNETRQFLEVLRNDPAKIIFNTKLGNPEDNLRKILASTKVSDATKDMLGQWYYNNVMVPEKMTPEQREAVEWKRKAQEYDTYKEQQEQARLTAENDARVGQALGILKAQIGEAMTEAGVPLTAKVAPQIAQRVAQVLRAGHIAGKAITPKEAMAKVKSEMTEYRKAYLDMLDEDKLVEELGKENAEKVRKYFLKAIKGKDTSVKSSSGNMPSAKRDERKTMTPDQFRDYLDDLKKKGK
jgi:hypothetical protein